MKTNANFVNTEVYANVEKLYAHIVDIFEDGQKSGEMKSDLNPRIARDIFVGTMDHIITHWLLNDRSYSLFDNLDQTFNLMVSAFDSHGTNSTDKDRTPESHLARSG